MSSLGKNLTTALALTFLLASPALAADDPAQVAADRYLEYLAFVPQAETLDELVPFHAEWWSQRKMQQSEDEKRTQLESEKKDIAERSDVEIVEATGSATEATLRLSATWNDLPMNGKVSMVQEDGSWRIDEEFWATGEAD